MGWQCTNKNTCETFFQKQYTYLHQVQLVLEGKTDLDLPKKIQMEFQILVHCACFTQEPDLQR